MSLITGGAGNDLLQSGAGADLIRGGAGNDTVAWQAAGSDTIDGGDGLDVLQLKTGTRSHLVTLGAGAGGHVSLSDTLAGSAGDGSSVAKSSASGGAPPPPPPPAYLDIDNVETFSVTVRPDSVVQVGDLSATDVRTLHLDVARLVTEAGGAVFEIGVAPGATTLLWQPLDASYLFVDRWAGPYDGTVVSSIDISHLTTADTVNVVGSGQSDILLTQGLANAFTLNVSGGAGDDVLGAGARGEVRGDAGDDQLSWASGGHPSLDGGVGDDRLFATAVGPDLTLRALAPGQLLLSSASGLQSAAIRNVEHVDIYGRSEFHASIQDLTNSGLSTVAVRLPSAPGGGVAGDGIAESVDISGSGGRDQFFLESRADGAVTVSRLANAGGAAPVVTVDHFDAKDGLRINAGAGDDNLQTLSLPATLQQLTLDGQGGNDVIFGPHGVPSQRLATLIGGDGDDTLTGGTGISRLIGGQGQDDLSAEGEATFVFDAADTGGADEVFDFRVYDSPSGGPRHQLIELDHYGYHSFADLAGHLVAGPVLDSVLITAPDGHTIALVHGFGVADLGAGHFLFG